LVQRLQNDEFDLVAVGRALLVDPEWAKKIQEGRTDDLVPFTREAMTVLT
jgi:2,4-dienoyl-CoA reductase-like NADH-dependent reductase (Old Yellow Enzyme family)